MRTIKSQFLIFIMPPLFVLIIGMIICLYFIFFFQVRYIATDLYINNIVFFEISCIMERMIHTILFCQSLEYQAHLNHLIFVRNIFQNFNNHVLLPNSKYELNTLNDFIVCKSSDYNYDQVYYQPIWIFHNSSMASFKNLPKVIKQEVSDLNYVFALLSTYFFAFQNDVTKYFSAPGKEGLFYQFPALKSDSCSRISTSGNFNQDEIHVQNIIMIHIILMIQDVEIGILLQNLLSTPEVY